MELRGYATSIAAFLVVSLACPSRYRFYLLLAGRLDLLKRRMTEAGTIPSASFCTPTLFLFVLGTLVDQFKVRVLSTPLLSAIGLFLLGYVASDVEAIFAFTLVGLGLFSVIVVAGLLGKAVLGMLSNRTGRAVIMTLCGFSPGFGSWISPFLRRDRDKEDKYICRCLISANCEKELPAELLVSVMQGKAMIYSQYIRAA